MGEAALRVLHVTASDQRRGAEVFAADLIAATGEGIAHHVAFAHSTGLQRVDYGCPTTALGTQAGAAGVLAGAWALRAVARRFRPHVVQAHGGEPLRLALLAGLGPRVPVVYRRIGTAPATMLHGWRRQWHRALMGRATTVVCVAEAVRVEAVERLELDPKRTVTIPNAVDRRRVVAGDPAGARAAVRAELDLPAGAPVILSLGALSWEKDPLAALAITAPLLGGDKGAHHLFAGDGPLRSAVAQEAGAYVVLAGSRPDVDRILAAADVVLFASRTGGMEGLPATVIEAGLARRPVVAFDVAGIGEVVQDGVTGILVPHGDHERARRAVADLLADAPRQDQLGAAAAERCGRLFTIEAVAPRYRQVWEDAAGR